MKPGALALLALLWAVPARAQQVELRWSRPRAFVHQQLQLDALVVHPVGLNPRWEAPPFEGFVVERLPSEGGTMRRDAPGSYVRTTRLRHALFPTRQGVIEVAASRIVFLDAAGRETTLSVPGTRLQVDALPQMGRPAGFEATVGEVSVRATLEPRSIALGEHASFELDVFGIANVWDVAAPDLEAALGAGCEVFAEAPRLARAEREQQLFARKTFRFSLVPSAPGRIAIPSLQIAHFDPERGEYRSARSDPLELEVRPAPAAGSEPDTRPATPAALESATAARGPVWLPTALLVASALAVAAALLRRPRPAPEGSPRAAPSSAPVDRSSSPRELLSRAQASLEEPSFGALLSRALRACCGEGDLSLTTAELARRSTDSELVALLRSIDAERFSGQASLARRRTLLDSAAAYVRRAEAARNGEPGAEFASTPPGRSR